MKVALASDHGGKRLKQEIAGLLQDLGVASALRSKNFS